MTTGRTPSSAHAAISGPTDRAVSHLRAGPTNKEIDAEVLTFIGRSKRKREVTSREVARAWTRHKNGAMAYTVAGYQPTPDSTPGARFDNVKIAKATEVAADIYALEQLTGYSLSDGGAFKRRLANMVRNGQIDPRFAPASGRARKAAMAPRAAVPRDMVPSPVMGRLASGRVIHAAIDHALGGGWLADIAVPPFGVTVARCSLSFAAGDPAAFPLDVPLSYSRKGLVALGGDSLFAELAIARLFVRSGWNAYWRDGYRQRWVADGDLSRRPVSLPRPSLGRSVIDVVQAARGSLSGCWDVLAWTHERVAFVESKRRGGDRLQETQGQWLDAALAVGVPREAFVVLEWDLTHTDSARPLGRQPI